MEVVLMQSACKIAISLPKEDFRELEKVRAKMGVGRSAVVAQAIRFWLQQRKNEQMIKRYQEGYRRKPERVVDLMAFEKAELEVLGTEENWS
jgi:hypothetical protein